MTLDRTGPLGDHRCHFQTKVLSAVSNLIVSLAWSQYFYVGLSAPTEVFGSAGGNVVPARSNRTAWRSPPKLGAFARLCGSGRCCHCRRVRLVLRRRAFRGGGCGRVGKRPITDAIDDQPEVFRVWGLTGQLGAQAPGRGPTGGVDLKFGCEVIGSRKACGCPSSWPVWYFGFAQGPGPGSYDSRPPAHRCMPDPCSLRAPST